MLVLVPGVGVEVNGNRNWIDFGGPFRLQPAEAAKLALVLWGAEVLARKRDRLDQWRELLVPLLPVTRDRARAGPRRAATWAPPSS